jgi:hypothetical protein
MRFEENRGQHDERARYVARQAGLTLFATDSSVVLSLRVPEPAVEGSQAGGAVAAGATGPGSVDVAGRLGAASVAEADGAREPSGAEGGETPSQHVGLRMWLEGGAERASLEAAEPLETRSNYLIGADPSGWHTDIPNWGSLRYRDVRPGVDLVLRGSAEGRIEYDVVVGPSASEAPVLRLEGAERLAVGRDGALEVHVPGGVLRQSAPVAYQEVDGQRVRVEAHYRVLGAERVQFELGHYDRRRPL